MVVHAAKVGRDLGNRSPIAVSPMIAVLAGRSAPSTKLCTAMTVLAIPMAAPNTTNWTSLNPVAPAIAPTPAVNRAVHTASVPIARATPRRA